MEIFLKAETWLALLTLTFFEVVLGIDNIIFISIVSNRLPVEIRAKTRNLGLVLAMFVRILLLLTITWVMRFKEPLFTIPGNFIFQQEDLAISGRDLILILGGLFLIAKSTREINHEMEGEEETLEAGGSGKVNVVGIIVQIILLDIIFSFDSILTAVGLTNQVIIMIIAVVLSIGIMIIFSGAISDFIHRHPSMEVLALGFLILIGFMLFLEGLHKEVPKGYIYFAIVFSMIIEMVNIRVRNRRKKAKEEFHDE
ncbi:Membrane protein TerC, possibly involved in tellurium resistance [Chryseolinea serpens]|jgi:predicted tellurium resistance membrane protein TerC|uniref:Membrane protein TerC, possibly involved in tellurium resistance n=1 Tax=Chryseolinea serpens TaxID=947013 RepID=A0A1M5LVU0_9BACT|nr:TerC family protein [Chryseolinea serpens]SHG69178.1 Membrane protein TerC, possibly involved in tellurium resistance [Chryseolinea serpens]